MEATSDWQTKCTEVKQRGAYLLQSGQWSDCTFLVGAEPHQVPIKGHKLILAMASPVFEAMFYGNMAEKNDPIPILDVQPEAFKALLEYMYTDNININSFDKACEVCYGAKKYMLPHLVEECTKYLWSDLTPRNACRAYEFARLFEEPNLMDKCMQIISTNTKEVLAESSFEDVELSTMITVFSQEYLNIDSELDLFKAAERYAKAQNKGSHESTPPTQDLGNKPTPSTSFTSMEVTPKTCDTVESISCTVVSKSTDPECELNSKDVPAEEEKIVPMDTQKTTAGKDSISLRSVIQQIRFLTLTPHEFAEGPAQSSLLTQSEAFALLMNILSSNCDIPMPEGFSTSLELRKSSRTMVSLTVDTPSPVMSDVHIHGNPIACSSSHDPLHAPADALVLHGGGANLAGASLAPSPVVPTLSLTSPMRCSRDRGELLRVNTESNKFYCQRTINQHTDCLNTSVLDCSVTFTVDKNICVIGVQVPTQVLSEESSVAGFFGAGSASTNPAYSELLYAHLLDADGARLTYTHYTSRVPYRSLLDITFNRPVYIQRNKVYKVGIVFNKVGWYPLGTCSQHVAVDSVFFNFGVGQSSDSVRDGLIRAIIFTF